MDGEGDGDGSARERIRENRYLKRVENLVDVYIQVIYLLTAIQIVSVASVAPLYLS